MSSGSWQKIRFDQICKNISDRIDDPKQAKTDYYVGLEHIEPGNLKIQKYGSPSEVKSSKFKFRPGNILFGRRRAYQRKLAVATVDGICSTDIFVLKHKKGPMLKGFPPLFMQSEEFFHRVLMLSAGSLSPRVKWKNLSKQEFLIPSIPEQENILSIIQKIDETISNAQKLLEKTKNYAISRRELLLTRGIGHTKFKKVPWLFGKEIEIPEEWNFTSIADTDIDVIDGDRGDEYPKLKDFSTLDYCLFLSAKNVTKIDFSFDNCSFISKQKDEKLRKGRLNRKDIIITTRGTIGNIAYFDDSVPYEIIRINSGMAILRNNDDLISQDFFYCFLKSAIIISQLQRLVYGTAQPQLTIGIINSLKIWFPSLKEQQKIASILSEIDEQIIQQQSHLTNLKVLRKSILNSKLTKEKIVVTN